MNKKTQWSGKTTSFHHKWNDTPNPETVEKSLRKVWFLDVQWTDCPIEVQEEVEKMWENYELGNDNCIVKTSIYKLKEKDYTLTRQFILEREPKIDPSDLILIHWWW